MNTRHAQLVLAVAREGSFTAAAKSLFIAQPTLSQQIRQIEQQLGAPIFERGTTPVSLTPAGQIYVQAARRFLQIETQMNESIAALSGHTAGLLRLGLPQQRADELLPQVLAEFQSVYPEVCVQAVSLPNDELERKLLGSELDMALVSGEAEDEKLEYQLIASDEVVLLAGRKTRLAQRIPSGSTISLNACEGEKFILPTESLPFTRSYDELLARAGLSPFVVLRTDDSQCAKRVCAACSLVMLCPFITLLSDTPAMQQLCALPSQRFALYLPVYGVPQRYAAHALCPDALYHDEQPFQGDDGIQAVKRQPVCNFLRIKKRPEAALTSAKVCKKLKLSHTRPIFCNFLRIKKRPEAALTPPKFAKTQTFTYAAHFLQFPTNQKAA
ncbi:MAG: LysR family transcriptional regulator [Christensenellales bacterium]